MSPLDDFLHSLGVAGRGAVNGATGLVTSWADPVTDYLNNNVLPLNWHQQRPGDAINAGLDSLGLARARNANDQYLQAMTGGLVGGGGVAKLAQAAVPVVTGGTQMLLRALGATPAAQAIQGGAAAVGGQGGYDTAKAMGADDRMASLAGLGGGLILGAGVPVPIGGVTGAARSAAMKAAGDTVEQLAKNGGKVVVPVEGGPPITAPKAEDIYSPKFLANLHRQFQQGAQMAEKYNTVTDYIYGEPTSIYDSMDAKDPAIHFFKAGWDAVKNGWGASADRMPKFVQGWRYGEIPEAGVSTNFAENRYEPGVSMMQIDGEPEHVGTYKMFNSAGKDKVPVAGFLIDQTGSDGEPLIIAPRRIDSLAAMGGSNAYDPSRPSRGY